jgi:hypothetical protein
MDERQRRTILWNKIEHLAFQPTDNRSWLRIYHKSLGRFWEVQPPDVTEVPNGFEACFLNLRCEYYVQARDKYSVRIINTASDRRCSWSVHVDPAYYSKAVLVDVQQDYPRQDIDRNLQADVIAVLDGMIFHPRAHCHGEDLELKMDLASGALPIHETRIGGGIENAFVFLTHLRFQFCLIAPQAREDEKTRLVNLFTTKTKNRERREIPAAEVLNLSR